MSLMDLIVWIVGVALVVTLYVISDLETIMRRSILWGGLYGALAGAVLGPIAIVVLMNVLHSLYGTTFLGLEIFAGPVVGAPVVAILSAVVGAIRGLRLIRRAKADADAAKLAL